MGEDIIGRLLRSAVVLFFASLITFVIAYAVPDDTAEGMAGLHATPDVSQRVRAVKGLDKPLYMQYECYRRRLLQFDSQQHRR